MKNLKAAENKHCLILIILLYMPYLNIVSVIKKQNKITLTAILGEKGLTAILVRVLCGKFPDMNLSFLISLTPHKLDLPCAAYQFAAE